MSSERRFDEPWNLPPPPSWCGSVAIVWAEQTPDERKAEWDRMPGWWHETVGRDRIEYWRSRL